MIVLTLSKYLGWMTKFNIAPDLGWRPFENHLISRRIVIVILENIVFIDKGNLHREVIEDEISLLDWKIAIAKKPVDYDGPALLPFP